MVRHLEQEEENKMKQKLIDAVILVIALVLEEEIKAMHHSNRFIGDAQDNMKVCRHKVNEVLKEYGYKDLMIKRDEKFRYRNDLANRIFEIYESL